MAVGLLAVACTGSRQLGAYAPTPPGDTFTCLVREKERTGAGMQLSDEDQADARDITAACGQPVQVDVDAAAA